MIAYDNLEFVVQGNFPASKEGSTVEYRVLQIGVTGAPDEIQAYTTSGVVDVGKGAFQTTLTLSQGFYSIEWHIQGTSLYANEEIDVRENVYDRFDTIDTSISGIGSSFYTVVGGGSRNGTEVGNTVTLTSQLLLNGNNFSPSSFDKVEIYPSITDAQNGTNLIETITTITEPSTGLATYTTGTISQTGYLVDKIYLTPTSGGAQISYIQSFLMTATTPSVGGSHEKVRVYINLFDVIDKPQKGDKVSVVMNYRHAWYGDDSIQQEKEVFRADANGQVIMDLIETDTLTADTFPDTGDDRFIYYNIDIAGKYQTKVKVPKGTVQANLKDLPVVTDDDDTFAGDL